MTDPTPSPEASSDPVNDSTPDQAEAPKAISDQQPIPPQPVIIADPVRPEQPPFGQPVYPQYGPGPHPSWAPPRNQWAPPQYPVQPAPHQQPPAYPNQNYYQVPPTAAQPPQQVEPPKSDKPSKKARNWIIALSAIIVGLLTALTIIGVNVYRDNRNDTNGTSGVVVPSTVPTQPGVTPDDPKGNGGESKPAPTMGGVNLNNGADLRFTVPSGYAFSIDPSKLNVIVPDQSVLPLGVIYPAGTDPTTVDPAKTVVIVQEETCDATRAKLPDDAITVNTDLGVQAPQAWTHPDLDGGAYSWWYVPVNDMPNGGVCSPVVIREGDNAGDVVRDDILHGSVS